MLWAVLGSFYISYAGHIFVFWAYNYIVTGKRSKICQLIIFPSHHTMTIVHDVIVLSNQMTLYETTPRYSSSTDMCAVHSRVGKRTNLTRYGHQKLFVILVLGTAGRACRSTRPDTAFRQGSRYLLEYVRDHVTRNARRGQSVPETHLCL